MVVYPQLPSMLTSYKTQKNIKVRKLTLIHLIRLQTLFRFHVFMHSLVLRNITGSQYGRWVGEARTQKKEIKKVQGEKRTEGNISGE